MENRGLVIWLYGLSGAGKSTLADLLQKELLHNKGIISKRLDGDIMRKGLNSDLGFSKKDRKENIRRVAEVAKLFSESGVLVICSFITPRVELRDFAKEIIGVKFFKPVFIDCSIETCINRDVKGLYKKAMNKEILNFTGISDPFEYPNIDEVKVITDKTKPEKSLASLLELLGM